MLKIVRYAAWGLVGALVAGFLVSKFLPTHREAISVADIGGPFQLTNHKGQRFTDADLAGRPYALFFGFTNCPDVCPTTLFELSERLKDLGWNGDALRVIFVTVDPERDTPEKLMEYLASFDQRITGLTGTEAQVEHIVAAYKAYRKKVLTNGDYTMDHTAIVYLFDSKGQLKGTLDRHESVEAQMQKLQRLLHPVQ